MALNISAKPRRVFGKQNKKLRKTGFIPAVLYGRGRNSFALEVSHKEFEKVYKEAGENTLVDLAVEGSAPAKVLIHEVAKHFSSPDPIHVDFYEVDLTRKIRAEVPLEFVGVSAAVKELAGILVKNITEVEVEALPTDLPKSIEVSLDKLKIFEDTIEISDLNLPDNVKLAGHNPEDVVVLVQEPRSEAELEELDKSTEDAEKEAIEGLAKEEGEAGEEAGKEGEVAAGEDQAAEQGSPPDKEKAKTEESKKKE